MMKVKLALFVLILASLACGGPQFVTPCEDCIKMVQPNGWQPSRDAQYASGVNAPNAVANEYNGRTAVDKAMATAIVNESWKSNPQGAEYQSGVAIGGLAGIVLLLLFLIFGGFMFLFAAYVKATNAARERKTERGEIVVRRDR